MILTLLVAINYSIIFNVPLANQIGGFFLLTLLPGLLLIQILKLDNVEKIGKLLLSIGLSIFFVMILGVLINFIIISLGYTNPLSLINLLLGFDLSIIFLVLICYKLNKNKIFTFNKFDIKRSEKIFLTVAVLITILSLLGTYIMQLTNNNVYLIFLLLSIPIYVAFATIYGKSVKRIYPIIIILIASSLQIIFMLRFPHIAGRDVHVEYFYFQTTLNTLQWNINLLSNNPLDACLSISILPAVYQLFTKMPNQEYLFKGLYVFIFSFAPLIIYKISKKYINQIYAFLASFLFMSQLIFMKTAASPRTNLAVFFVALLVMVLFDDKIGSLQKKILALIFLVSVIISHYSTAYIFLILITLSWIITKIFSTKFKFSRNISIIFIVLFFALTFLWYGQVTDVAFTKGINFIGNTFFSLNNFFFDEMREDSITKLAGVGLTSPILSGINLILTWIIFIFIGLGVLKTFLNYKENLNINIFNKKFNLLSKKIEIEYAILALIACALLALTIVIPFISKGYDLQRTYIFTTVFLSFFFIFGALNISKLLKLRSKQCLLILLILVPYSLFATGVIYEIAGFQSDATLSSNGTSLDQLYITDGESASALWISNNNINETIYAPDFSAKSILISQGIISLTKINQYSISQGKSKLKGYVYISNFAMKYGITVNDSSISIENYSPLYNKSEIYESGSSLIYI